MVTDPSASRSSGRTSRSAASRPASSTRHSTGPSDCSARSRTRSPSSSASRSSRRHSDAATISPAPSHRLDEALRGPEQTEVRCRIAALHEATDDTDAAVQWWEAAPRDRARRAARARRAGPPLHRARALRGPGQGPASPRGRERPEPDVTAHLDRLASLLDDRLGDLDGAIVVLWRLAHAKDRPDDADERLEHALERAGRYEELAQHLLDRRRALDDGTPEALSLDLRRARAAARPVVPVRGGRAHLPQRTAHRAR